MSQTVCTLYPVINRSCCVWVVGGEGIHTNHASRMTEIYHRHKGKVVSHCKGNSFWPLVSFSHGHKAHECRREFESRLSDKSKASVAPICLSIPCLTVTKGSLDGGELPLETSLTHAHAPSSTLKRVKGCSHLMVRTKKKYKYKKIRDAKFTDGQPGAGTWR